MGVATGSRALLARGGIRRGPSGSERARPSPAGERLLALAVAAVSAAVIFARRPGAFIHPQLWAEDGGFFFQEAYNNGGLANLLHQHASYLVLLDRAVAAVALGFPVAWVPAIFTAAAVGCQVLPAVLLVSDRSASLIRRRTTRVVVAAVYLALPNTYEIDANLVNAQWHLALAAILVLVGAPRQTRRGLAADAAVVALAGLTGPFGVLLPLLAVPLAVLRRARREAALSVIAVGTAIAQLTCLANSPRPAPEPIGPSVHLLLRILGGQVVLSPLIGSGGYAYLIRHHASDAVFAAACLVGAVLVTLVMVRGSAELRLVVGFSLLVMAAALISPAAGTGRGAWADLARPGVGGRYWFLPMMALVVAAAFFVERAPRRLVVPGVALLAVAAGVGMRIDFRYPAYTNFHYARYAARFQRLPRGARLAFPINPPGWRMTLRHH